jgi:trimethylamine-N-oxide reductase (cytochrome c)
MVQLKNGEQVFTNCTTGGPVFVYVKDGKIVRMEPLQYQPDDGGKWVIEARGKKFTPGDTARLASYIMTERSKIYSKERALYPMLREDWSPENRNPQNRGKSGYKRISWDEALDILASETIRIQKTYGPGAVMTTASSHHNWGNIRYRHSSYFRFMGILNATYCDHNPDSWEGWHWGAMHAWGYAWRLGVPEQYDLLEDALKNTELIVFWSSDPDGEPMIYTGQESTSWRFWLKEVGVQMVFIDPHLNYTAITHSDKWFAPRPGTDAALAVAIANVWLNEGTMIKIISLPALMASINSSNM